MCYYFNGCAPFFMFDSNPTIKIFKLLVTNVFHEGGPKKCSSRALVVVMHEYQIHSGTSFLINVYQVSKPNGL